jgi:hypothetical protein
LASRGVPVTVVLMPLLVASFSCGSERPLDGATRRLSLARAR